MAGVFAAQALETMLRDMVSRPLLLALATSFSGVGSWTELSGYGYVRKALSPGSWQFAAAGSGAVRAEYPEQIFLFDQAGVYPRAVSHYVLLSDETSPQVRWALPCAFVITEAGAALNIEVRLRLGIAGGAG